MFMGFRGLGCRLQSIYRDLGLAFRICIGFRVSALESVGGVFRFSYIHR